VAKYTLPFSKPVKSDHNLNFWYFQNNHIKTTKIFSFRSSPDPRIFKKTQSDPKLIRAHLCKVVEVFGLWLSWFRFQSCFANFESESNPDSVQTRFKQSDIWLSQGKYKSTKQTVTFFSVNVKSKSNQDPATGKKTSLLVQLEAAGVGIQKILNPVHAHLCKVGSSGAQEPELGPDPGFRSRLRKDSAFFFRTRIRARSQKFGKNRTRIWSHFSI